MYMYIKYTNQHKFNLSISGCLWMTSKWFTHVVIIPAQTCYQDFYQNNYIIFSWSMHTRLLWITQPHFHHDSGGLASLRTTYTLCGMDRISTTTTAMEITLMAQFTRGQIKPQKQPHLQSSRQITWWVISISDDVVAFIDRVKQHERVADTEYCGETSSEYLSRRRTGILCDLIGQLLDEFLLTLFDVRLQTWGIRYQIREPLVGLNAYWTIKK